MLTQRTAQNVHTDTNQWIKFFLLHVISPVLSKYPSHGALFYLFRQNTKMNFSLLLTI